MASVNLTTQTITNTSITVIANWSTNNNGGTLYFNRDGGDPVATFSVSEQNGSQTYTYTGLSPNTQYTLGVRYTNVLGDTANSTITPTTTCYLKNTLILCADDQYKKISDLVVGETIKTTQDIKKIKGIQKILYSVKDTNPLHKIYKLSKSIAPELIEDLYITGGHSILVDELTEKEIDRMKKYFTNGIPQIDGKYKLLACVDERFEQVEFDEPIELYHLLLENENIDDEYAILANGILSESISERFYKYNNGI